MPDKNSKFVWWSVVSEIALTCQQVTMSFWEPNTKPDPIGVSLPATRTTPHGLSTCCELTLNWTWAKDCQVKTESVRMTAARILMSTFIFFLSLAAFKRG